MIKKILLIGFFVSLPSMAVVGYLIHWLSMYLHATWNIVLGPVIYNFILSIALSVTVWLTAGGLIKELKARQITKAEPQKPNLNASEEILKK